MRPLELAILTESFAICRLPPATPLPLWAQTGPLQSATRTADELSIVCLEGALPAAQASQRGWRAIRVSGPLDLSLTGILVSLAEPLAEAGVSIFAVSTHDTDYVLVPDASLPRAVEALTAAGHRFREPTR